jgi:hypothetical protein
MLAVSFKTECVPWHKPMKMAVNAKFKYSVMDCNINNDDQGMW